jgi:DNA-directed RNA polymerase specialized sigma24 family protein
MQISDRELRRAFRSEPSSERFQPIVERYLPFVYAAAYRQLANQSDAGLVARAVFLALARRWRSLRRKTGLAGWLFEALQVATRKLRRRRGVKVGTALAVANPSAADLDDRRKEQAGLFPGFFRGRT